MCFFSLFFLKKIKVALIERKPVIPNFRLFKAAVTKVSISQDKTSKMTTENNAARFVWRKNGPKPVSKTNLSSDSWLIKTAICTPDNLEVNFKAGSREFGLHSEYTEGKLSELSLKRKYS